MNKEGSSYNTDKKTEMRVLADQVMEQLPAILQKYEMEMDEWQLYKLDLHIHAMARRSLSGDILADFDKSPFEGISQQSLDMAREVAALFGELPHEEILLLSLYFEYVLDPSRRPYGRLMT